jgi:heat shock protein HslJ
VNAARSLAALLLFAGCAGDDTAPAPTPVTSTTPPTTPPTTLVVTTTVPVATTSPPFDVSQILEGSEWELDAWFTSAEAQAVPRGARDSTIQFDGGVAVLDTSCNTGSVNYAIAGQQVTFQSLVLTELGCDSPAAAVEAAIVDTLDGTTTVSFAAGVMFIDRDDRRLVYLAD